MRVERLGSESSLTLGETSSGGGSAVGEFNMGIERSSFVSVIVAGSSITVAEVFFLNSSQSILSMHQPE